MAVLPVMSILSIHRDHILIHTYQHTKPDVGTVGSAKKIFIDHLSFVVNVAGV